MAHSQRAELSIAHLRRHLTGLEQFAQQVACPRIKSLARSRQPWLARSAFKQRRLQQVFQLLDLPAQCRLRHKQPLGRCAEAAALGDFDEVTQLPGGNHKSCLFEMSDGL